MATEPFAQPADITAAWRPLSVEEQARATYWIAVASRRIRRRWRDVDERVDLDPQDARWLDTAEVKDVVVTLVVEVLGGPEVPHARAMSVGSGSESRSVQLDRSGAVELPPFYGWMVEVFEGLSDQATAAGSFPRPLPLNNVFSTKELYR